MQKMPVLECNLTHRMWWKEPDKCKEVAAARLEEKDNCHVDNDDYNSDHVDNDDHDNYDACMHAGKDRGEVHEEGRGWGLEKPPH